MAALPDDPLACGSDDEARALCTGLHAIGYSAPGLGAAYGLDDGAHILLIRPVEPPTQPVGAALEAVIRLLLLGEAVAAADLTSAFGGVEPGRLEELGLLRIDGGDATAVVDLVPYAGLWFASDRPWKAAAGPSPNHVMSVNASSLALDYFTVRVPVDDALDLGCGGAVQAVLAARHSRRVVGTDVNLRALNMGRFNAWLNGAPRVELREGSLFEPVAGETFDLIVSSPPFVISPESDLVFRDGGMAGDSFSEAVVRGAAEHLREGGLAHVLCNWAVIDGEGVDGGDDDAAPRRWVEGGGCDAVVFRHRVEDPGQYAARWVTADAHDDDVVAEIGRWVAYYREQRISRLASGFVLQRKRAATDRWLAVYETPEGGLSHAGDALARLVAAQDLLDEVGEPSGLLSARLVSTPGHVVEQRLVREHLGYRVDSAVAGMEDGIPFRVALDDLGAALLDRCDGRPLADVVAEVAAYRGVAPHALHAPAATVAWVLVAHGFLVEAG